MNITLVISSLQSGGAERVLSNLANYWADKGHPITLITLDQPNQKPFYALRETIRLVQINQLLESANAVKRLGKMAQRFYALRKAIKQSSPDVVLSFIDIMNVSVLIATTGLNTSVLVSERIDPHFHPIPALHRWMRKIFYPKAHKVVVQTQSAAAYFPKLGEKVLTIPNSVSKPPFCKEGKSKAAINLATVGRLDKQKDHETLLRAFAIALRAQPHLKLTLYGEGPERERLVLLIKELTIQDSVFMPGVAANIYEELAKADVFIFPSLYEGFPNALCEAMSMGLPVIASDCSGNIDIIQDFVNGRLFPKGDALALAKLIVELIDDPEKTAQLGLNAQKICQDYSPSTIYAKWDALLESATSMRI